MDKEGKVIVNNLDAEHERFVVARLFDGKLWFFGSWMEKMDAEKIADKFENGIVVEVP